MWSFCESSFCVDPGWTDMSIPGWQQPVDNQHFAVCMKRQLPINVEGIDSQDFTVHMNCQSSIINPSGVEEGLRTIQPHYWSLTSCPMWDLCSPTISVCSMGLPLVGQREMGDPAQNIFGIPTKAIEPAVVQVCFRSFKSRILYRVIMVHPKHLVPSVFLE